MTVGKSVSDAIIRYAEGNFEGALRDICGVVEGTAKAEGLPSGGRSYKEWVDRNTPFMLLVATYGALHTNDFSIGYSHPKIRASSTGAATLAQIIYHAIRCELYHEGLTPRDIEFTEDLFRGAGVDGKLGLPKTLVLGLILAVVVSPANAGNQLPSDFVYRIGNVPLHLNYFWGKKQDFQDAVAYARLIF